MTKRKLSTQAAGAKKKQKIEETEQRQADRPEKKEATAPKRGRNKAQIPQTTVLQQGRIFFFYRPKVQLTEVHSINDVQRLYMVLEPFGEHVQSEHVDTEIDRANKLADEFNAEEAKMREEGHVEKADLMHQHASEFIRLMRSISMSKMESAQVEIPAVLVIIGNKRLPEVGGHQNAYCFTDLVGSMQEIHEALEMQHYETATKGERTVEGARPLAEGLYRIVRHEHDTPSASHTSLVYALQLPHKLGNAQRDFNIGQEGSFVCTVRNPSIPGDRGLKTKAELPEELLERFESMQKGRTTRRSKAEFKPRTFAPLTPDFLTFKHVEFLLFKTDKSPIDEFGEIAKELVDSAEAEYEDAVAQTDGSPQEKLMSSVGMSADSEAHPTDALLAGKFV